MSQENVRDIGRDKWLTLALDQRLLNRLSIIAVVLIFIEVAIFWSLSSARVPTISGALGTIVLITFFLSAAILLLVYFVIVFLLFILASQIYLDRYFSSIAIGLSALFPPALPAMVFMMHLSLQKTWGTLNLESGLFGLSRRTIDSLKTGSLCILCGYNLKGNQSGICPECGRSIDAT